MLDAISAAIRQGRYTGGLHTALRQFERGISDEDIRLAVGGDQPEIIEDYPDDPRGHSCLIRGEDNTGVLHLVCAVDDLVFLISCYRPDPDQWYPSFRRRR